MRHRHSTPFEMVEFKFHCAMPIFVARQWIRHRTANVNEYSMRYSLPALMFYMPNEEDFAAQSKTNKQGRGDQLDESLYTMAGAMWDRGRRYNSAIYQQLAENNVARELARIDLPLSTYTQWYWKIDLHNLLHFLTLRCHPHAQKEVRVYAGAMAAIVQRLVPITFEAWYDYRFTAVELSGIEARLIAKNVEIGSLGLRPATGRGYMTNDFMIEEGMSQREINDLGLKLRAAEEAKQVDFQQYLDWERVMNPEQAEARWNEHVPQVDIKKD